MTIEGTSPNHFIVLLKTLQFTPPNLQLILLNISTSLLHVDGTRTSELYCCRIDPP